MVGQQIYRVLLIDFIVSIVQTLRWVLISIFSTVYHFLKLYHKLNALYHNLLQCTIFNFSRTIYQPLYHKLEPYHIFCTTNSKCTIKFLYHFSTTNILIFSPHIFVYVPRCFLCTTYSYNPLNMIWTILECTTRTLCTMYHISRLYHAPHIKTVPYLLSISRTA